MDIDSAASTPIVKGTGQASDARYLRYDLTALGYHLVEQPSGFSALVIGPGGGRDLLSALVFGATRVDGVEINPIIARDVMLDRFRAYSGGIYQDPLVNVHVDDGRSFVRRSPTRYDVIQASLVDTWGLPPPVPTRSPRTRCTRPRHWKNTGSPSDRGILTITRWI